MPRSYLCFSFAKFGGHSWFTVQNWVSNKDTRTYKLCHIYPKHQSSIYVIILLHARSKFLESIKQIYAKQIDLLIYDRKIHLTRLESELECSNVLWLPLEKVWVSNFPLPCQGETKLSFQQT